MEEKENLLIRILIIGKMGNKFLMLRPKFHRKEISENIYFYVICVNLLQGPLSPEWKWEKPFYRTACDLLLYFR